MKRKTKIEFNPIECHSKPKYKIGTLFLDSLHQEWKYCGIKILREAPMIYRWVPFAWWAQFKIDV